MTEREIPEDVGFLFGGLTDTSSFAPLAVSEPEKLMPEDFSIDVAQDAGTPVFRSRREMRAAGGYAVFAVPELVEPTSDEPAVAPSRSDKPTKAASAADATQAMNVAEIFGFITDTPIDHSAPDHSAPGASAPVVSSLAAPTAAAASDITTPAVRASEFPTRRSHRDEPTGPPKLKRSARTAAARAARAAAADRPSARPPLARPNSAGALDRKTLGQRITGIGVMVLIGGLFTVLALPAYADNDASALTSSARLGSAQKLAVSAAAADSATKVTRDGYTATSAADLKTLYASAIRQQNLTSYLQSGAKAQGDDYPWFAELSRNQGGGLSPLNYYYRECVDFVAWRLNRDQGSTTAPFKWVWSNLTPNGGNASQWKSAWLSHGWATGTTPQVGAVAWFPYNHVAYVSGILTDGSVLVEEYNWEGQHLYGTRVIQPGDAYYLYAPPA